MRSLFKAAALAVALSLFTPTVALSARPLQQGETTAAPLTNKDVIEMVRAKVPEEIIIEKIKSSPCKFDRSVDAIVELQDKGVPKNVMLAMLDAMSPPASKTMRRQAPAPGATEVAEIVVPADTAIDVETAYSISSEDVSEGSRIGLIVVNPVKVGGVTVIERNARATAVVTKASGGRSWGRGGKLAWEMKDVIAVDGTRIPLQFSSGSKTGGGKTGSMATGMIVTGLLFLPAAPLWGFKKGKAAVVPGGKQFQVYTRADAAVQAAR